MSRYGKWNLLLLDAHGARLFGRPGGSTPLAGFNVSHSIDAESRIMAAEALTRNGLSFIAAQGLHTR